MPRRVAVKEALHTLAWEGSAGRAQDAEGTVYSSGFWRLHSRQVHEEVPKLCHVDIFSVGDMPAFSILNEIPESYWIKELQKQPADMPGYY